MESGRSAELERRRGVPSERDDRWSDVRSTAPPRWLWPAIEHPTGTGVAYGCGRRQADGFLPLHQRLEPCGSTKVYTAGWGAYERHLDAEQPQGGKENTQTIERNHSKLRTRIQRLVRRTLCVAKTERRHDLVIGLFSNRYAFGQGL